MNNSKNILDLPLKTRLLVMSNALTGKEQGILGAWWRGFFWGLVTAFLSWFVFGSALSR